VRNEKRFKNKKISVVHLENVGIFIYKMLLPKLKFDPRSSQTAGSSKTLFWGALRDKQLEEVKFHRQRLFIRYILDFLLLLNG
jgi:hypothetical protein